MGLSYNPPTWPHHCFGCVSWVETHSSYHTQSHALRRSIGIRWQWRLWVGKGQLVRDNVKYVGSGPKDMGGDQIHTPTFSFAGGLVWFCRFWQEFNRVDGPHFRLTLCASPLSLDSAAGVGTFWGDYTVQIVAGGWSFIALFVEWRLNGQEWVLYNKNNEVAWPEK